jgi:Ca2+-binding RTX toxin-like protein
VLASQISLLKTEVQVDECAWPSDIGFITAIGSGEVDTIVAEAAGQTLEGKAGSDTLIGPIGAGDTFLGTAAELKGDTIGNFAGTNVIDITDLTPGSSLSLSYTQRASSGDLTASEGG